MVLDKPQPGDIVWRCPACNKSYQPAEIDVRDPVCRDITCRSPLRQGRF